MMPRPGEDEDDEQAEADRRTARLAGLAVVLFLAVIGLFLAERLRTQSDLEDCLMSGRTNCAPIPDNPR